MSFLVSSLAGVKTFSSQSEMMRSKSFSKPLILNVVVACDVYKLADAPIFWKARFNSSKLFDCEPCNSQYIMARSRSGSSIEPWLYSISKVKMSLYGFFVENKVKLSLIWVISTSFPNSITCGLTSETSFASIIIAKSDLASVFLASIGFQFGLSTLSLSGKPIFERMSRKSSVK